MQIGGHNHCHFHSLPTLTFQDLLSLLMATDPSSDTLPVGWPALAPGGPGRG